jgi:glycosyltransferase involved in cell wall biosynthesis
MPSLDIIIPVHNRPEVLEQALACLKDQQIPPGWQINAIVANDGMHPEITQVIHDVSATNPSWLTCTRVDIAKSGIASARNAALKVSSAPLILLLGADILLRPQALAKHLAFHAQHPEIEAAALGGVTWDPRLSPTPFMEWMTHGGPQNDFDSILGQVVVDSARYFYASNLSLKSAFLPKPAFDLDYKTYGYEDFDLGQRLTRRGLKLFFLPQALGLHHHFYSVADIYKRQRAVGKNSLIFQSKHKLPDLPRLTPKRRIKLQLWKIGGGSYLVRRLLEITAKTHSFPRIFAKVSGEQFWRGVS